MVVIVLVMVAVVIVVVIRGRSYNNDVNSSAKTHLGFNRSVDFDLDPEEIKEKAQQMTDKGTHMNSISGK